MRHPISLARVYQAATIPRAALLGAFLFIMMNPSLDDPDYYWHLETGRFIVDSLSLPRVDLFSFTASDHPWVPHEWLFQGLLYLSYVVGGYLGTKILTAVLGATMLVVVYITVQRLLNNMGVALALMVGFFVGMLPGMTPRPQLVTYICFAVFLTVLLELKYLGRTSRLWLMPALMVIWVNSHGGYIIGLVVVISFVATERLAISLSKDVNPVRRQNLGKLVLVALVCVAASLCNPEFYHHWLYPFAVVSMQATNLLNDWASPNFRTRYGFLILMMIGCYAIVYMNRRKPPDLTEILVPGMLIVLAFQSKRNLPFALFATTLFAAGGLYREAASVAFNSADGCRRRGQSSMALLKSHSPAFAWFLLMLFLGTAVTTYSKWRGYELGRIRSLYAVDAVNFVERIGLSGRMFNEYEHGGYLIHRLRPQKVFIDGRADVYGDQLIFEWSKIKNGDAEWRRLFGSHQIDYVILRRKTPLRQLLLEGDEFVLVYDDQTASVLVRITTRYAEIIEKYRVNPPDR